ncbi:nuclear transport factor 2 family protein [Bradyrhizobium sp. Arg816]|uniref:nuclear transport factor 2 family protein n=1 Tax=Bradyrhizobium sp. Arg816 TaxID=2998491 RepID=UPI00249F4F27|nr:nuclear transport factor 2 family protein [Bradyrhizobium sp. Arg816]MDI3562054.1 nuclear transport factor 2 family protein [Bradyrhizobium sp. Arg816]
MESPSSLADRYVAVWNETDTERRKSRIAELWGPEGRHYVGDRKVEGREALERRVRESHEKNVRNNRNRFRAAGDARRVHDTVVFHWEMLPASGDSVLARGLEFLVVDDSGKIVADYQFFPA